MPRTLAALAVATMIIANACGGEAAPETTADPSGAAARPTPSLRPSAVPTVDPEGALCQRVGEMELRLATLRTVELTLPNRTSLEIEFDKLQAAYRELERVELGDRADELEDSLTRLRYRMGELKLAVEDFQTNSKPRRAAPHVEEDSLKAADELNAFVIHRIRIPGLHPVLVIDHIHGVIAQPAAGLWRAWCVSLHE